jgi:hypothetical protein
MSRPCATCSQCAPRVPWSPSLESGLPRARRLRHRASRPPASRSAPRPASHAPPFDSRQNANAFNQPLSFDTSKVKNMYGMFYVRSARALRPPSPESGPPRACRACASTASHPPASRRAPRPASPAPPFDSAAIDDVQPAAEPQHLHGYEHVRHVQRALRACPGPEALSRAFAVHAACAAAASHPPASRPAPHPTSHAPPFDSAARVRLQPAAEL